MKNSNQKSGLISLARTAFAAAVILGSGFATQASASTCNIVNLQYEFDGVFSSTGAIPGNRDYDLNSTSTLAQCVQEAVIDYSSAGSGTKLPPYNLPIGTLAVGKVQGTIDFNGHTYWVIGTVTKQLGTFVDTSFKTWIERNVNVTQTLER